MKLYTEEQVRQSFRNGFIYANLNKINENQTIDSLVPIELPSDEEIKAEFTVGNQIFLDRIDGAKWMRDKIQGGNQ